MKSNIKSTLFLALSLPCIMQACSVPQKVQSSSIQALPEKFIADRKPAEDSLTIASLLFKDFFKDEKLQHLISDVLAHNLDYKIANQQLKIANAYLQSRKWALLPSIGLAARSSGTHYGKYTIEGVGNFDTNLSPNIEDNQRVNEKLTPDYWLGLNASWELDIWGKLWQMKTAARNRYMAGEQGRNLIKTALITQTAMLYYDLICLDKELIVLNENIELQNKALEIVTIQKDVGRATELAVQQFVAQLRNTEAAMYEVKQQIIATENQLLALSGKYDGTIERSARIDMLAIQYLKNHGKPVALLEKRPDVLAAYHDLKASHADAKAARAAFFPTLSLSAYGAYNAFNSALVFNPASLAYQIFGGITAPLFQQGQLRANFKVANAQQEVAFYNYQKTVVGAYQEVNTLLTYIDNNQKILDVKKQEVDALKQSVEISNDLYVTAYAGYLELIAAQKSKLTADLDYVKAKRNQMHVFIQLYKALGGGVN